MAGSDADAVAAIDDARRFDWVAQVARWAERQPDKAALIDGATGRMVTYAELWRRVTSLAGALARRDISKGDRVVTLMTNRFEFVEATLATNLLGAIAVPVNFRLTAAEVTFVLEDCGAKAVIVSADLVSTMAAAREDIDHRGACLVVGSGRDVHRAGAGAEDYESLVGGSRPERPVRVEQSDTAFIMYTSGTTGRPKGAVLSVLNLNLQALTLARLWRIDDENVVNLAGSPLFHIGALSAVLPVLLFGGTNVIMPSGAFSSSGVLDAMEQHGVTCCFLVPVQWQAVCDDPTLGERRLRLEVVAWGAAPAPRSLLERMAAAFPDARIIATFGQTEMSPITCALIGPDAPRKIGSVGRPIPTIDVRIVDDAMQDVAVGDVGEIVYRGPTVMLGYWGRPEETAEAFRGGWFHSGDLVRQDEEGFLYVVDRLKDMIISGGENIYSAEIERVIERHPLVAEVAVVGVPHAVWGETPVAVVTPASEANPPTADDIIALCRLELASYKKPTAVVLMPALPRNATGKIQKAVLREHLRSNASGLSGH